MLKSYYLLTKPGIIMGNVLMVVSGFALASQGQFSWLLLAVALGISLVIASACVINNYTDRASDERMARTKNRALVTGKITSKNALLFAGALAVIGFFLLSYYSNWLTVAIAFTGFIVYVILYGFSKYLSTYGTIIGSVAGGVPPVIGYCAVSNYIDLGAVLLFLIMVLWQMPHFFAIAIYRFNDYHAASIPVLPVKRGIPRTKIHMLLYIMGFILATFLLTFYGYMGYIYLIASSILGTIWLVMCVFGFTSKNDTLWARKMFQFSLVIISSMALMISLK